MLLVRFLNLIISLFFVYFSIIFIFPAQCFLSDFSIFSYHFFCLFFHYLYLSCPMLPIRQCLGTHTSCQISLVRRRWPPLTTALIIGISIRRTSHKSNLTLYKGHILHSTKDTVHGNDHCPDNRYQSLSSHVWFTLHIRQDTSHIMHCIHERCSTQYTAHITLDTRHSTHSRRHSTWEEHPKIIVTYLKLTPSLSPHSHQLSDIPNLIVRFPFFDF